MVRLLALILGVLLTFGVVAAILLQVVPGPHQPTDYLVIGGVATFAAMLVLFFVLINGWIRSPDVFFKRRGSKPPES